MRSIEEQEGVTPEAAAVAVGPVGDQAHGLVQAELRRIQVAVRGQLDGIRPVEATVLTYRWTLDRGWVFEEFQPLVQGLDGSLKPGTVLSAQDVALIGPTLNWAWSMVEQHRPRG